MEFSSILNSFVDYKTMYFNSITAFFLTYSLANDNSLNVFSCDIRSVKNIFDELLLFLKNDVCSKHLDFIILTETWHDVNCCNYVIPGYNLYYSKLERNQND